MGRRTECSAAAALLLLGLALAAAQPAAGAPAEALAPLAVAMAALPESVRLAILESAQQLISDQAQHRIDLAYRYVQGFGALPQGQSALTDGATRDAYAWAEQTVETFLTLPAQFDAIETGGSICRSYGNNATAEQVTRALALGAEGAATMAALRAEMARLSDEFPGQVDRAPFDAAVALLDQWRATEGADIAACLLTLHVDDAPPPSPDAATLFAVVIPPRTYPTGHARIVGTATRLDRVGASSPGLGLSSQQPVVNGTFRIPFTVPRKATLGNHTLTVSAGDLHVDLTLDVERAAVDLHLQVPGRVVSNTTFGAQASAVSPAGLAEVDRAAVRLVWLGNATSIVLHNGTGQARLEAGPPGQVRLVATYPGTDILLPATAELTIQVFIPGGQGDTYAGAQHRAPLPGHSGLPVSWFWWLLALLLGLLVALLLYLMPVIIHRLRGVRSQALRGVPSPPRWPGADSFAAAVGALFDLLRRRRLAPPSQTLREWLAAHGGPAIIADRFEAVRYGGEPEDATLRKTGLAWAQGAWDRWRER